MLLGYFFNADAALVTIADLKEVLKHAFTQGEFEMAVIVEMANAENGSEFKVGSRASWIRRGEYVGSSEDMGRGSSIREVITAQVGSEAGRTDAAEAAICYHAVRGLNEGRS